MPRCLPLKIVFLGLLAANALAACGGGGSGDANELAATPIPPPPVTSKPADAWAGRYVGAVTIDGVDYYGDALFTEDGMVRLYVGGLYDANGVVPQTRPESSMQFFGSLQGSGNQASGSGRVFGQQCAPSNSDLYCDAAWPADASIVVDSGNAQGHIAVTHSGINEIWTLQLSSFSNYYLDLRASQTSLAGQYRELLAEFSVDGDTIVSIDAQGVLSFQSPDSGCTGIGSVKPHLTGAFDVYDVSLDINGCVGAHAYLNSAYVGLATTSPSTAWDYDNLLLIWLTQQYADVWDSPSPPALTMLGQPQSQ